MSDLSTLKYYVAIAIEKAKLIASSGRGGAGSEIIVGSGAELIALEALKKHLRRSGFIETAIDVWSEYIADQVLKGRAKALWKSAEKIWDYDDGDYSNGTITANVNPGWRNQLVRGSAELQFALYADYANKDFLLSAHGSVDLTSGSARGAYTVSTIVIGKFNASFVVTGALQVGTQSKRVGKG